VTEMFSCAFARGRLLALLESAHGDAGTDAP
jgi:hypothetical protein